VDAESGTTSFNESTFMTGISDKGKKVITDKSQSYKSLREGDKGRILIPDPHYWKHVEEQHKVLNDYVNNLSKTMSTQMAQQETDFLAAYRAHMYAVQKDLQELRKKVEDAETSLQKNDKVHKLEEERSWYRKEALRLDSFTTSMKKDLKYMKEKLESIEDDRNWLERQLKASKKQNKLLRAELEIRLGSATHSFNQTAGQMQLTENMNQNMNHTPAPGMFPPAITRSQENLLQAAYNHHGNDRPSSSMSDRPTRSKGRPNKASIDSSSISEMERHHQKEIRDLKQQNANQKKLVAQLRSNVVANQTQRAELEEFFLKCIESVKREIGRRRKKICSGERQEYPACTLEKPAIKI